MIVVHEGRAIEADPCPQCRGAGKIFKAVYGTGWFLQVDKAYRYTQECDECNGIGYIPKERR